MQAILPSKPLKEAVQQLTATLGGSGNPLLEMLYLQSAPGELCLSSTNGKISQHIRVKGEVTRGSTLLVPGAPFRSLLHYCVGETTRLVLQENTLHIQSGGFAADLKQSAPHHYPALEWAEGEISLPGHLLAEALETVAYPAKTQITPELQGVRLEIRPEGMRTVATDNFRLAWQEYPLEHPSPPAEALLPLPFVRLVAQALKHHPQPVRLKLDEQAVTIRADGLALHSHLLSGRFPPYQQVAAFQTPYCITLEAPLLAEALKRMALLHSGRAPRVTLQAADGQLTLHTQGELGTATERLAAEVQAPITFHVNAYYLLEALEPLPGSASLYLLKPDSPLRLEGSRPGYRAILAPMK